MDRRFDSLGQQEKIRLQYRTSEGDAEQAVPIDTSWVRLVDCGIIEIDLSPLEAFRDLERISILHNPIEELDLSPLGNCEKLTRLDLGGTELQNIDLTPLQDLQRVEHVTIHGTLSKRVDLAPLSEWSLLRFLVLNYNQFESIDLSPLRSCSHLEALDLGHNQIESIDLRPLSLCSKLKHLSMMDNRLQEVDLTHLRTLTNLFSLDLERNRLQEVDLRPLSSCPRLASVSLSGNLLQKIEWHSIPTLVRLELDENRLRQIDLSPLSSCSNLETLYLSENQLRSVELAPLASCPDLRTLRLDDNDIESIDISPLSGCVKLSKLLLDRNKLEEIDLSPLAGMANLEWLCLDDNRLQHVDLVPLSSLPRVSLYLKGNQIGSIDVTPLVLFNRVVELRLDEGSILTSKLDREVFRRYAGEFWETRTTFDDSSASTWASLYTLAERQNRVFPLYVYQQALLEALDLSHFGLIDTDIREVFEEVPLTAEPDEVRRAVLSDLLQIVARQIDDGGTTIGLDLDALMKYGEIATRADKIAALRRNEMDSVKIPLDVKIPLPQYRAGLLPLWLTAYGFRILDSLKMGLSCGEEDLNRIEALVDETGFDLQVVEWNLLSYRQLTEVPPSVNVSEDMSRYVSYLISVKRRN